MHGWTRRFEEAGALARDLIAMIEDIKSQRDAWLAAQGLTLAQARALPPEQRSTLDQLWQAHVEGGQHHA